MPGDEKNALVGRTIAGKFAIESVIGQGAMGVVYRAKQVALDKTVAIKVMHRSPRMSSGGTPPSTNEKSGAMSGDEMFAARFLREAKAASRIDHPNSMRVIDFGEEPDGLLYMAMEHLDGRDLFSVIKDEFPLAPARVVDILLQALAAVAAAHDMGVVHRDLKPENIMVMKVTDDEGHPKDLVKVCDFGIAKITARTTDLSKSESGLGPKLTTAGLVVGTPEYMSPEQGRGEALDARSDIYSIGIIMFQLLTSRVPFEAETALGVVLKHVTDEPPRPTSMVPSTDPRLEAICLRAMEKKRESRYQTAREMRAELRALQGESLSNVAVRAPPPPRGDRLSLPTAATEVAFDSGAVRAGVGAYPQAERTQSKVTPLGTELDDAVLPRRRWAGLAIAALLMGATFTVIGARVVESRRASADPTAASGMPSASTPPTPASVTPVDDTNDVAPLETASVSHPHHPKAPPRVDAGAAENPVSSGSATPPPAGAYDPSHARVAIAGITPHNTDNRSVREVINLKDFSDCYRGGLVGMKTRPPVIHNTLKLETDDQGRIKSAFLVGPKTAGSGGQCIIDSMPGKTMGGSGEVGADVDLEFLPGEAPTAP